MSKSATNLHVIELWRNYDWGKPNRTDIDVVLGTRDEEWEPKQHIYTESKLAAFDASSKQMSEQSTAENDDYFINW